ncbi:hypothetical protein GCM10027203_75110 [Nonomuraea fastidiosa]
MRAVFNAAAQRFRDALGRLLREPQEAGVVRADVRNDDLAALLAGRAATAAPPAAGAPTAAASPGDRPRRTRPTCTTSWPPSASAARISTISTCCGLRAWGATSSAAAWALIR